MSSTVIPQPSSQPPSRKYPEYISWVPPFPASLSYKRQTIEVEPSKKDNESGIIRNSQTGLYDLSNPLVRKNVSQLFQSGYQLPKSVSHPQLKSGLKKSGYSYTSDGPHPPLHPADEESGSKPCLGHRPLLSLNPPAYSPEFLWMTYEDVDRRRRELGSALKWYGKKLESDGLKRGRDDVMVPEEMKDEMGLEMDTVCVWAVNSIEWQILDFACQAYNKVITALYDSSNNDTVGTSDLALLMIASNFQSTEFILNHAESNILFSTIDHLATVFQIFPKLKYLRGVVLMHSEKELGLYEAQGRTVEIAKSWAKSLGVDIWGIEEFMKIGREHLSEPIDLPPQAVYSLCYTSGTTGYPKAAILTHGQVALTVSAGSWGIMDSQAGIVMSALPLPHVYQRLINNTPLNRGGAIGIPVPNPLFLLEDMQLLKPSVLASVPRVLNRVYQAIISRFSDGGVKASLFHRAVKTKIEILRSTGRVDHPIWDRLIFNKIKPIFGGNLALLPCGSAATSPDILDFFQIAFGCRLYNGKSCLIERSSPFPSSFSHEHRYLNYIGYGLTETFGLSFRMLPHDPTGSFTVGAPAAHVEVKLVDVPDLGYFVHSRSSSGSEDGREESPRGELWLRNPAGARCLGYYKDPVSTRYTFDSDGWIHTGDIAEIDDCGRFKIIDRKKNIIKLSNGEFVALERVESLYSASPVVAQLFVYGDMTRDYLVAVVVPIEATGPGGNKSFSTDHNLKTSILLALDEQAETVGLQRYEIIRNIHVTNGMFSVEEDTLTPTLKIRRREAYMKYKDVIEELYKMPLPSLSSSSRAGESQGKL